MAEGAGAGEPPRTEGSGAVAEGAPGTEGSGAVAGGTGAEEPRTRREPLFGRRALQPVPRYCRAWRAALTGVSRRAGCARVAACV